MGYQVCVRCVMDTSDSLIEFDEAGVCSHCRFVERDPRSRRSPAEKRRTLSETADRIRAAGAGRDVDCVLGLSGGIDSSYLALQAHKLGLRPLIVHVDTGWNSELATKNIENIVRRLDLDLITEVIDWDEMRDLQLAFLKSGVPNQDIPQDHAIVCSLHRIAVQEGIGWVLDGNNWASESVLPRSWGYDNLDAAHILAIHRRFGERPLRRFPLLPLSDCVRMIAGFPEPPYKRVSLLNLLDYSRETALAELRETVGFRPYEGKHGESRFTRFFQGHILFNRFGYDKRRAHLSSLILSGQIGRDEALSTLEQPPFDEDTLRVEKAFVAKKLGLAEAGLDELLAQPRRHHAEFPTGEALVQRSATLLAQASRLCAEAAETLAAMDRHLGLRDPLDDFPPIDRSTPLFLYGTGVYGKRVLAALHRAGYGVTGFIDSTRDGVCEGLPVRTLGAYRDSHHPENQILICSQHAAEIAALLDAAGITGYHRPRNAGV
mgnify:CR=1 FL=1